MKAFFISKLGVKAPIAYRLASVNEDTTLNFTPQHFGLLANSTESIRITSIPGRGIFQLYSSDGSAKIIKTNDVISLQQINAGMLRFLPDANQFGTNYARFNYEVQKNSVAISNSAIQINVASVYDPPTSANTNITVNKNSITSIALGNFNFVSFENKVTQVNLFTSSPSFTNLQYLDRNVWKAVTKDINLTSSDLTAGKLRFVGSPSSGINNANIQYSVFDGITWSNKASLTFSIIDRPPVVSGDPNGRVKEDQNLILQKLQTSGSLLIRDPDPGDIVKFIATTYSGIVGSLQINESGAWQYTANNNATAIQQLAEGERRTESFTVLSTNDSVSTTITITLLGTNDAPSFSGASTGSVSEDSNVSSGILISSGTLNITDADSNQSFVTARSNVVGSYGTFSIGTDGAWTYTANNSAPAIQALASGSILKDSFTVTSKDNTASQIVTITINGTNDAPIFSGTSTGSVTEDTSVIAGKLTSTGKLNISDADSTQAFINARSNVVGNYGIFSIGTGGAWTYTANNSATGIQALRSGNLETDSFTVTSKDNTASQTVTITINGTNDAPAAVADTATVKEDVTLSATGNVLINDTDFDVGDTKTAALIGSGSSSYGTLSLNSNGSYTYTLNNNAINSLGAGASVTDIYTYKVTDSQGASATATITVTIQGTNDAPVAYATTAQVTEDTATTTTGNVLASVSDPDTGDRLTVSLVGSNTSSYGTLTLGTNGNYTYRLNNNAVQNLGANSSITDVYTYKATDSQGATGTATLTITIKGNNDIPTFSGTITGSVTEDTNISSGNLTSSGTLNVTDADSNESFVTPRSNVAGSYGTFSIGTGGAWTYTANNSAAAIQALGAGSKLTDSFSVTSQDGSASQTVTITINGTNDLPTFSGTITSSIIEDTLVSSGKLMSSGTLNILDADSNESFVTARSNVIGSYGTFSIGTGGAWTYTANNSATAIQALGSGSFVTDSFTVTSKDNTASQTVTITINGTNDSPTFSGTITGSVTEDTNVSSGDLTSSGTLNISDADSNQAFVTAQSNVVGSYGTFSIGSSGAWTYTANNSASAIQALGAGSKLTDTFTVSSQDGSASQTVTITINGTNDVPVAYATTAQVTEDTATPTTGNVLASVSDPDDGNTLTVSLIGSNTSSYGTLTIGTDGAYTYTLNNNAVQYLGANDSITDVFTYLVTDSQSSSSSTLTITINGSNDAALIGGTSLGSVTEDSSVTIDGFITASGSLTINDPDTTTNQDYFNSLTDYQGSGNLGLFSIDSNGAWHYKLDNSLNAVQQLNLGENIKDSFSVTSADGTSRIIEITINGSDDQTQNNTPVLTSLTFVENSLNTAPAIIDNRLSLANTALTAATITVSYLNGSSSDDQLSIQNQGISTDKVGITGNKVTYEGNEIATITSPGLNGQNLVISFSSSIIAAQAINAVVRAFLYQNNSDDPLSNRTIHVELANSAGVILNSKDYSISITPSADSVTLTSGNDTFITGSENDIFNATANTLSVSDYLNGGGGNDAISLSNGGNYLFDSSYNSQIINIESFYFVAGYSYSVILAENFNAVNSYYAYDMSNNDSFMLDISNNSQAFQITSGAGNDVITLGSGASTVSTQSGNDVINVSFFNYANQVINGGLGTDTLGINYGGINSLQNGININLTSIENIKLNSSSNYSLTLDNSLSGLTSIDATNLLSSNILQLNASSLITGLSISLGNNSNNITTGSGEDTVTVPLTALANSNLINTGSGNDTLIISGGGSGTLGAQLNNSLIGIENYKLASGSSYTIVFQSGLTAITSLDASALKTSDSLNFDGTSISGTFGITGGAGNDTFSMNTGYFNTGDVINGGDGNDTLQLTNGGSLTLTSAYNTTLTNVEILKLTTGSNYSITIGSGYIGITNLNASDLTSSNTLTYNGSAYEGSITISGGSGNDSITLGSGVSTALGNSGNDNIFIAVSNLTADDSIDGGSGSDTLTLTGGGSINLTGSYNTKLLNMELMTFASGADYTVNLSADFSAIAAFDTQALASNTYTMNASASATAISITDGAGNINVTLGSGNDKVTLGAGNDTIDTGSGDDVLTMALSNLNTSDSLNGGSGNDLINLSGGGSLTLNSSSINMLMGFETIKLVAGANYTITLDQGIDTINKIDASSLVGVNFLTLNANNYTGSLSVTGGTYTDDITIGSGIDSVSAGNGNDNVNITPGNLTNLDFIDGGAGTDTLRFINGGTQQLDSTFNSRLVNLESITFLNGYNYFINIGNGFSAISSINASSLTAGSSLNLNANTLTTAVTILTGSGNNAVTTGSGSDTISLASGSDAVLTGAGDDTIVVSSSNLNTDDSLDGGDGTDSLSLLGGASLTLTSSYNTLLTNIEKIKLSAGFSYTLGFDAGYSAITTVDGSALLSATNLTLNAANVSVGLTITDGAGNDSLTLGAGNDTAYLGSGNDTLSTGDGNDVIIMALTNLDANDIINAGSNNDFDILQLTGGGNFTSALNNSLIGIDQVKVTQGSNYVVGITSGFTAVTSFDASSLLNTNYFYCYASDATSSLYIIGGSGDDRATLGAGNDTVLAGSGNDTIQVSTVNITTDDFFDGGDGTDTLILFWDTPLTLTSAFNDRIKNMELLKFIGSLSNTQTGNLTLGAGFTAINTISASQLNSGWKFTLNASAVNIDLNITDGAGDDSITSGSGNDSITLATGNDTVITGDGNDLVTISLANLTSSDNINTGTNSDNDTLALTGGGTLALTTAFNTSLVGIENLVVTTGASYTLNLSSGFTAIKNFNASNLASSNIFTFSASALTTSFSITGGAGNDVVSLGSGNDRVVLGGGNDSVTVALANLTGADSIDGGDGTDSLTLTGGGTLTVDNGFLNTFISIENLILNSAANYIINYTSGITSPNFINASALSSANTLTYSGANYNSTLTISGGAGNDAITLGLGDETVSAGSGNDTINIRLSQFNSADSLDGGAGTDTIQLTDGGSLNLTSAFNSKISNFESFTFKQGFNYNINLGSGYTGLTTFNGQALLVNDSLTVDATNLAAAITFTDGAGNDSVTTSAGNSTIILTAGNNSVTTGSGNDTITLGTGNDTVFSGGGIDSISVALAQLTTSDYIDAGDGSDSLTLTGGGSFTFTSLFNTTLLNIESIKAGAGANFTATYNSGFSSVSRVDASALLSTYALNFNGASASTALTIIDGAGNDFITTSSLNDIITLTTGNDTVVTGDGNDQIYIAVANLNSSDTIDMGSNSDFDSLNLLNGGTLALNNTFNTKLIGVDAIITATAASYTFNIASGYTGVTNFDASTLPIPYLLTVSAAATNNSFNITGGAGADVVSLGSGNDKLTLGGGNDTVTVAVGNLDINDSIDGGAGTDTLTFTGGGTLTLSNTLNTVLTNMEVINLGSGANWTLILNSDFSALNNIRANALSTLYTFNFNAQASSLALTVTDGAGNDSITTGSGDDVIYLNVGNDTVVTGTGNDTINIATTNLSTSDILNAGGNTTFDILSLLGGGTLSLTSGFNSSLIGFEILKAATNTSYTFTLASDFTALSAFDASVLGSTSILTLTASSSSLNLSITGGSGNDSISLGSGNDTVSAGSGNDIISIAMNNLSASDLIDGASGTDTLLITGGGSYTLNNALTSGVSNFEYLSVGAGANWSLTIAADYVATSLFTASLLASTNTYSINASAKSTSITITDGAGNDSITLGSGDDTVYLSTGDDNVNTGGGNDSISMALANLNANDILNTGLGNDTLTLTGGGTLSLTSGNNTSLVGIESLVLSAGASYTVNISAGYSAINNFNASALLSTQVLSIGASTATTGLTITDGAANDKITTGSGNDVFYIGNGNNTVVSGDGNDVFYINQSYLNQLDQFNAGSNNDYDTFVLVGGGSFSFSSAYNTLITGFDNFQLAAGSSYSITFLAGFTSFSRVDGSLLSSGNVLTFDGSLMNISLTVTDSINDDSIKTGIVSDTVTLTSGNDTVSTFAGNDVVCIDMSNLTSLDYIDGGADTDTLKFLAGGTFTFDSSYNGRLNNIESIGFSNGYIYKLIIDTGFSAITSINAQNVSINNGFELSAVNSGSNLTVIDSTFDDIISTGSGADIVSLSTGNDIVNTGSGNDIINISASGLNNDDKIEGGIGNDTLNITGGGSITFNSSLNASLSNIEMLTVSNGSDYVIGFDAGFSAITTISASALGSSNTLTFNGSSSAYSLSITGGSGNDNISLGSGTDSVTAGSGNDIINIASTNLTLNDYIDGAAGTDSLNFIGNTEFSFTSAFNNSLLGIESVTFQSGYNHILTLGNGFTSINIFNASMLSSQNYLSLNASALATGITVYDSAGNDLITTGSGNDTLSLSSGNDIVSLGAGDDSIAFSGLSGNVFTSADTINGGDGSDSLVMTGGGSLSLTSDLSNVFTSVENIRFTAGSNYTIQIGANFYAITNIIADNLSSSNTLTVSASSSNASLSIIGGAGNDSISLGSGVNNVVAGSGNDSIYAALSTFDTRDIVDAGSGTDTLIFSGGGNLSIDSDFNRRITGVEGIAFNDNKTYNISFLQANNSLVKFDASSILSGYSLLLNAAIMSVSMNVIDGAGNDSITTGSGSDLISLGTGNDTVFTGTGADTVYVSYTNLDQNDYLNGGVDSDLDTIELTNGGNFTLTNAFNSSLVNFDQIRFRSGYDYQLTLGAGFTSISKFTTSVSAFTNSVQINAQSSTNNLSITLDAGNDAVTLGSGDDTVTLGAGNDSLTVQAVNLNASDFIDAGSGTDRLILTGGGTFNMTQTVGNRILGFESILLNDDYNYSIYMQLGSFTNTITSIDARALSSTSSLLFSAPSTSSNSLTVYDGAGNDTITTSGGNDTITLTTGNDSVFAAGGNDTISMDQQQLTSSDIINGDTGTDTLILTGGGTSIFDSLFNAVLLNLELIRFAANFNASVTLASGYTSVGNFSASDYAATNNLTLNAQAYTSNLSITGGAGNDSILLGSGIDTVLAGSGDDQITVSTTNLTTGDSIDGGAGNDTLLFSSGSALTLTSSFNTRLLNLESAGFVDGSNYSITLSSGFSAFSNFNASNLTGSNNLTLNASALTTSVNVTGGAGNDQITLGSGNDTVSLGAGDDNIFVSFSNLTSADSIKGGAGIDKLTISTSSSITFTSALNSVLSEIEVLSFLSGSDYNVIINSDFNAISQIDLTTLTTNSMSLQAFSTLALTVYDGAGSNYITTGSNNDTISLSSGNDLAWSFNGDDTVYIATANLNSSDDINGGNGTDTLVLTNGGTLSFTSAFNSKLTNMEVLKTAAGGDYDLTYQSGYTPIPLLNASELGSGNTLRFNASANTTSLTITGGAGNDSITTGSGNDIVSAGSGNDTVVTGSGNDSLYGEAGNDYLDGGLGADYLSGGAGNDTLIYDASDFTGAVSTRVDGGLDTDSLKLLTSGISLDLTTMDNILIQGIENIDITGSGNNTLRMNVSDVVDLSNTTNTLTVNGNAGDVVYLNQFGTWDWSYVGIDAATNQYRWTTVTSDQINNPNPNADVYVDQSITIYINSTLFTG